MSNDDRCRFCHDAVESTNHLLSGCAVLLADGLYTKRHNKICRYIHWKLCEKFGLEKKKIWEHNPQPVIGNEQITIFYDHIIRPGRYIEGNGIKPDIVIWNKNEKTGQIIDVSVPNDFGLNRAERAKLMKYQDLKNDLKKTWSLKKVEIIPIIVGATGLLKSNSASYLEKIPGELNQSEIQMGAITGTVSILKRALAYEHL